MAVGYPDLLRILQPCVPAGTTVVGSTGNTGGPAGVGTAVAVGTAVGVGVLVGAGFGVGTASAVGRTVGRMVTWATGVGAGAGGSEQAAVNERAVAISKRRTSRPERRGDESFRMVTTRHSFMDHPVLAAPRVPPSCREIDTVGLMRSIMGRSRIPVQHTRRLSRARFPHYAGLAYSNVQVPHCVSLTRSIQLPSTLWKAGTVYSAER